MTTTTVSGRLARTPAVPPATRRPGLAETLRSEFTKICSVRSTYWTLLAQAVASIAWAVLYCEGTVSHAGGQQVVNAAFASLTLLREAKQRGWLQPYHSELPTVYSDYIGLEDEAQSISNYESLCVPGLLQTEAYARAQLRGSLPHASEEDVEARVAARMERQPVLVKDGAPKLWAIMDEAALRRVVGDRDVMRAQVLHLLEVRSQPNVTIQVIPFGAGAHPGVAGSFITLDFPGAADQSIVYIESAAGGLFLEEEPEIRRYMLMFEHLRAAASGLDATVALLTGIAAEI